MIKLIKSLFAKKELPKEGIRAEELPEWFSSKTKAILQDLDMKINGVIKEVEEEKEKTRNSLQNLKNAQLQNPNIPFKAKQLMEGNREAYIKKVYSFLEQIRIERDYEKLHNFCISFNDALDNFGKSTLKQYYVLQEFFANESKSIASNIKNFDNFVKELKRIVEKQNIEKLKRIKENVAEFQLQAEQKRNLLRDLDKIKAINKELVNVRQDLEEKIKELKVSKEHSELMALEQKREGIKKDFDNNNLLLANSFSVIEAALKKYARISFEEERLITHYLQNPVDAINNDSELKVISILDRLNNSMMSNKIELKDRKKERIHKEIESMDRDFFDKFIKGYNELKDKSKKINDEINKNEIKKTLEEYNEKLNENGNDIGVSEQKIGSIKKEIEKIDIEKIKKELEKEISGLLKIEVVIS